MNNCIFSGRLTKSLELESVNGVAKTRITLAIKRGFKNKDGDYDSDFVTVNVWRQQAEYVVKYMNQGDYVELQASFRSSTYEKDGEKEYYQSFECQSIRLINHAKGSGEICAGEDNGGDGDLMGLGQEH